MTHTDIVIQLRDDYQKTVELCAEAADEIVRLKAECAEQRRLKEGYYNEAADGWAAAAEKDREIDRLRRENNSLRGQPND